jgi:uncharacterized protein (DUF2132 family)
LPIGLWPAFIPGMTTHKSRDPLHGITLETIVNRLQEEHGWVELGRRIPIRCFLHDPSVKSSLTFLRKTPWARKKVEALYVQSLPP